MEKICSLMNKKFDGKSVHGDKYIKAKIKLYKDNVSTKCQDKYTKRKYRIQMFVIGNAKFC